MHTILKQYDPTQKKLLDHPVVLIEYNDYFCFHKERFNKYHNPSGTWYYVIHIKSMFSIAMVPYSEAKNIAKSFSTFFDYDEYTITEQEKEFGGRWAYKEYIKGKMIKVPVCTWKKGYYELSSWRKYHAYV